MMALWGALGISNAMLAAVCGYFLSRRAGSAPAASVVVGFGAAGTVIVVYVAVSTFVVQYLDR
jgi:hypothetical protein